MLSRYKMTNLTAFILKHFSAHQSEMRKLTCKPLSYTQMHCVLQLNYVFGDVISNSLLQFQRENALEKLHGYLQKMFIKIYILKDLTHELCYLFSMFF